MVGYACDMLTHIGCSGYAYRGWQGCWYPDDVKPQRWFSFYAERFSTVEINASFYRFPTTNVVDRWRRQAPAGFVYSIKTPRLITHFKRFAGTDRLIADFYDTVTGLGDKLGCVLFQLPPQACFDPDKLTAILAQLNAGIHNVIEFRHESWWQRKVFDALAGAGATFCSVDAPGLPKDLIVCGGRLYMRMHGDPWYAKDYSQAELHGWAERIEACEADQAWVYFNNDANAAAARNAAMLAQMLERS
jgi:uncharacterized protein YecE (DUF72 family)